MRSWWLILSIVILPAWVWGASGPTILNLCDPAKWTAAKIGRQGLVAAGGTGEGALVLTGGAFDGGAPAGSERLAADAAMVDAAGFDVVNLAHRDLRGDAASLASAIEKSKAVYISACFQLPQGHATPWKPMAVVESAGHKIAFIGLAEESASMRLPDSGVMKRLRFTSPQEALKQVIPQAQQAAQIIVVLADAPIYQAAQWIKDYPQISAVIVSGRGGGGIEVPGQNKVFRAPPGGGALGVVSIGGGAKAVALSSPSTPSDAFTAVARQYALVPAPLEAMKPDQTPQANGALSELMPGKINPTVISGRNAAATLSVSSVSLMDEYGATKARSGQRLLVVDTHWRNILTPQIVRDKKVPVVYKIPRLADHLYCVADGVRLLSHVEPSDHPGLLSWGELSLPEMGSTAEGRLLFDVPADAIPRRLVLRFYDFAHGPIVLPLVIPPDASAALVQARPDVPLQKNDLLEMGVYQFHKANQFRGQTAPAGKMFVAFDLRARSLFTTLADASLYDPKAQPGRKTAVGTVADWKDSRRYEQLLVDGQYAYAPVEASALAPVPRFLPDVMTGDQLAFLVPADAKTLELWCGFPNARLPDGKVIHPRLLRFALQAGSPPAAAPAKPIAAVKDDVFDVSVLAQQRTSELVGLKALDGQAFLTLTVRVVNTGKNAEFFQPREQLKYAAEDGGQSAPDEISRQLPHPPIDPLWLAAGQARTFEVAYRIGANQTHPRLAYAGVSLAKVVDLAPLVSAPKQPPNKQAASQPPAVAQASAVQTSTPPPAAGVEPPKAQPPAAPAAKSDASAKPGLPTVPVHPDIQPRGLAGVGLTPEQVNAAIDRGRDFLWEYVKTHDLQKGHERLGDDATHSLVMLALVHADAQKKYPDFDAQLRAYFARVKPEDIGGSQTYRAGLLCMTIDGYGDTTFLPQMRRAARYLVEAQGARGTWDYGVNVDPSVFADPNQGLALQVNGGTALDGQGAIHKPWTRLTAWNKGEDGDNSNTQYALLGLASALRDGVLPPIDTWKRALDAQRKGQSDDGGWGYNANQSGYGSMTTAGICAIALARHALGEKNPEIDPQIEQGLAWLNANFSVEENPNSGGWNYYYLYSIERVGRILNTEFIGDHEWYPLGAKYLVGTQKADGSWVGGGPEDDPRLASGFALLFLTRATPSMKVEIKRGGSGTLNTAAVASTQRLYIILDASGSMLDEMDGKNKFEVARAAVASIIKELPDSAQVALRVYGSRKRAIEPQADEDSILEIPMGKLDKPAFLAKLKTLRARGKTPLAWSLQQAKSDLSGLGDDQPVTVLLLTDGGEDTFPRRDPVKAAAELAQMKNVRLRIVGFNINRDDWARQLDAMTAAGHGLYWPAARTDELESEVRSAVLGIPRTFSITDMQAKPVAQGHFGQSLKLPEGHYRFITDFAGRQFASDLWINTDATTTVLFDGDNAMKAQPLSGAPPPPVPAASPPAAVRYCTHCGAPLPPGAKFCPKCGAKVE